MSNPTLVPADLRLIHLVAARRRGDPAPAIDEAAITALLGEVSGADPTTPFIRAAALAQGVFRLVGDTPLARQMSVLALSAQLAIEGFSLVAPQGVLAGMIRSAGNNNAGALARWLEDRSIPTSSD